MGAGMEVVEGMHVGQSHRGAGRKLGDAGALHVYDHTAFQVHSSGWGQAGIGRSSGESLNTGCYKKAPVRCR